MFHDLKIAEVRPEGGNAVAITFDVPADLQAAFAFQPGQYLTLRAEIGGVDLRRSYSLACPPGAGLTVGVRHLDGGVFSTFAQGLRPGDWIQVMPPEGRFVWGGEMEVLLIAAGSGITPMVSIASAALSGGAEVTLVYGNRRTDTIMFRDTLNDLKDRYLDRFTVIHVLSQESQDVPMFEGRINAAKIRALIEAGLIAPETADAVFLCGPERMIADVECALGVPDTRIRKELFTVLGGFALPPSPAAAQAVQGGVEISLRLDGAERKITMQKGDESVLAAARRAGLDLPHSCTGGMCCTCRCRITEGTAEMAVNYSLEPWEVEAGFTLACQARPTSERLSLDFDAV
jgi:ring-1,2-phenylacetyl-CoA epoxidase subunit PaaE